MLLLLASLKSNTALSQINFYQGSWENAKYEAYSKNKLIFIDAFASWCGPCKRMSAYVFPDVSLGDYVNARFVSLKIDMEGYRYRDFINRYADEVDAYPTLLFLNSNGDVIAKHVGYLDATKLIALTRRLWLDNRP